MKAYVKLESCVDIIPTLIEEAKNSMSVEAALQQSLLDASRMFDEETLVREGFYLQAGNEFTEKTFYPTASKFLRLEPFAQLESVKDENGDLVDVDSYIISSEQYPRLKWIWHVCGSYYYFRKIVIKARWGFPCIPSSVALAVKSMGCLMFLTNSQGNLGVELTLTEEQETRLRQTYNRIAVQWQGKNFNAKNTGIG